MCQNNKINIALICTRFIDGGTETYILNKARWLSRNNYVVTIVSSGGIKVNDIDNYISHLTINDIDKNPALISSKKKNDVTDKLIQLVNEKKITAVETYELNPVKYVFLSNIILLGTKVNLVILSELGFKKDPILQLILFYFDSVNCLYTLNKSMVDMLNTQIFFKLKNIKIINLPVEHVPIYPTKIKPYILSVCRMSKEKMYIKHLISDFKDLKSSLGNEELMLYVVGDGPLLLSVKSLVNNLDSEVSSRIKLFGTIKGKPLQILFQNCWIYVGMGTTLINAGVYGKPSIISSFEDEFMHKALGIFGHRNNDSFGQRNKFSEPDSYKNYINRFFNKSYYNNISKKTFDYVSGNYLLNDIMISWDIIYKSIFRINKFLYRLTHLLINLIMIIHKSWRKLKNVSI